MSSMKSVFDASPLQEKNTKYYNWLSCFMGIETIHVETKLGDFVFPA